MQEFIKLLRTRYQKLHERLPHTAEVERHQYSSIINTLTLAEVLLQKSRLPEEKNLRNVVVFGPTQSGKSTLVNSLLPEPLAGVSSLAGFTVHPQGFTSLADPVPNLAPDAFAANVFREYEKRNQQDLDSGNLKSYSLTVTGPALFASDTSTILWDTPDFDSINAQGYSEAVLRSLAMADVLVMIVSKEKYADQSVWEMLEIIRGLKIPLIVCLNKLGDRESEVLRESFKRRYESHFSASEAPVIVTIPYITREQDLDASDLIAELNRVIKKDNPLAPFALASNFIKRNWEHWLAPVYAELQADKDWSKNLDVEIEKALDVYRKKYLEHPYHYATFQQTLAELLVLLEIPGLARPLARARSVITWPVRQVVSLGKSLITNRKSLAGSEQTVDGASEYEVKLLKQLADILVTQLANASLDSGLNGKKHEPVWEVNFRQRLYQSRPTLEKQFDKLIDVYQERFNEEVHSTAASLYDKLEEQRFVLNSLRAARATGDATAVVLAFKTGGIGVNDFILAPAMLSVSSLLTESSLGQYINVVKARLKNKQMEAVKFLFSKHLQMNLSHIRDNAMARHKFRISERQIREAVSALAIT